MWGPTQPFFWIIISVGAAAVLAVTRWVGVAIADKFRKWITDPAEHTAELKAAIGIPNGNGDLMTMVSRALAWQMEHDAKDDQTRSDVAAIKTYLRLDDDDES